MKPWGSESSHFLNAAFDLDYNTYIKPKSRTFYLQTFKKPMNVPQPPFLFCISHASGLLFLSRDLGFLLAHLIIFFVDMTRHSITNIISFMKPKRRCIKLDYCTYFFVAGFLGEKLSFHLASTHSFPLCWFSSLSYNSQYLLFSLEEIKMGPLKNTTRIAI